MIELLDILRLFGGVVYLVLGGDLLVRGALGLSARTSIPPVIVGLTVVALGTSAPELVISVYAALSGFSEVALGNVLGSNVANVFLVLGAPALISPVLADAPGLKQQTWYMIGVTALFIAFCFGGVISRIEGFVLVGVLVASLVLVYRLGIEIPGAETPDESEQFERVLGLPNKLWIAVFFVTLGILMLPLGANLTVEGAVAIATALDIPEIVIGSTIIALGTSLPELSTTLIAAFHRSSDIALGNVIGSNALNILLVAGVSASIATLPVPAGVLRFDAWVVLAAALAMLVYVLRRKPIGRVGGALFLAGYVSYVVVLMQQ